jgi:hypothetical protein
MSDTPFPNDAGAGTEYIYPFTGNGFDRSPDVQALVKSGNAELDSIIQNLSRLNLGLYLDKHGDWLDWIAKGVYGLVRPSIVLSQVLSNQGGFNSFGFNQHPFNFAINSNTLAFATLNDDEFKKWLQWHLYRADGFQFCVPWLKNRVARFIGDSVNNVSISLAGHTFTITIPTTPDAIILKYLFVSGYLEVPENFIFTVVLV